MAKPRIYFLVNSLEGGGAERVITNLSEKLKSKYEVDIITLKSGTFYELPEGVRHISLSTTKSNLMMIFLFPILFFRFRNLIKKEHYKNGMSFLEIANFIHILSKRDALVSFRTNIGVFKGVYGFFYRSLIRLAYPHAGQIIVNSEENRSDLAKYLHLPLEKIVTLYNPIDLGAVERLKDEPLNENTQKKLQGKKVFVTVGRLVGDTDIGSKNHSLVLSIIKKLVDQGETSIAYMIVGDGPAMGELRAQVKRDNLEEYVIFTGKQKNVFQFLAHADYVIYASRHEGFPNVLIEAMAAGIPIITSNFKTGAHEVIMGEYAGDTAYSYPLFGPNGVILDLEDFRKQFFEIYPKLDTLTQEKKGIERFLQGAEQFSKII